MATMVCRLKKKKRTEEKLAAPGSLCPCMDSCTNQPAKLFLPTQFSGLHISSGSYFRDAGKVGQEVPGSTAVGGGGGGGGDKICELLGSCS